MTDAVLTSEGQIGRYLGVNRSAARWLIDARAFPWTHVGGRTMARIADLDRYKAAIGESLSSAADLARWADDGGALGAGA